VNTPQKTGEIPPAAHHPATKDKVQRLAFTEDIHRAAQQGRSPQAIVNCGAQQEQPATSADSEKEGRDLQKTSVTDGFFWRIKVTIGHRYRTHIKPTTSAR